MITGLLPIADNPVISYRYPKTFPDTRLPKGKKSPASLFSVKNTEQSKQREKF